MSPEEISKKVNKKKADLFNATHSESLPANFMGMFKRALFSFAPAADKLNALFQKDWIAKEEKDLSFNEVSKMVEIIVNTPRKEVFNSIEEACEVVAQLSILFDKVRLKTIDYTKQLETLETALTNMKGTVKPQKQKGKKTGMASV